MSELIPCPFCDAKNTDIGFIAHTDGCYLMRRYMNAPKAKLLESWNIRPREAELLARADAAERENERLTNFYKQAMNVASSIYAACTYQDEPTAAAGKYGLPRDVWMALDKLIQEAHDLSDHNGEQK